MQGLILKALGAIGFSALLSPGAYAWPCRPVNVIIVDRSAFYATARNGVLALGAGMSALPEAYTESSNIAEFARHVACHHPRLLVAHYSMFRTPNVDRGRQLSFFLSQVEKLQPNRAHYVLYSSSFRHAKFHPDGRTLAGMRADGYFSDIPGARVTLIYVPSGARFRQGNGVAELRGAACKSLKSCT